jgi:hypothetical protein
LGLGSYHLNADDIIVLGLPALGQHLALPQELVYETAFVLGLTPLFNNVVGTLAAAIGSREPVLLSAVFGVVVDCLLVLKTGFTIACCGIETRVECIEATSTRV